MKRFFAAVCILCVFAFTAPQTGALTVTNRVMTDNIAVSQQSTGDMISVARKDKRRVRKLYEPALDNNMISLGKLTKAHG